MSSSRSDLDPPAADPKSPTRPRKPDHRVSMGPEKAWSIGSDDLNNAQDGQVEKAIAEVLAGVEPNARSRKASHSLRFFKEGLPEASIKKKESRLGLKDKLRASDDVFYDEPVHGDDHTKSLQPSPHTKGDTPGRLKRTKTLPLPIAAQESQPLARETMDYFQIQPEYRQHPTSPTPARGQPPRAPKSPALENSIAAAPRQDVGGSESMIAVHAEDGELSGEEKISSAVFVPHKGPQGMPEGSDESEADVVDVDKPPTRSDHGSAWLVKADEPEADEPDTDQVQREMQITAVGDQDFLGSSQDGVVGEVIQLHATPEHSKPTKCDVSREVSPQYSQIPSLGYGEHVHDHQVDTNQPLDAIELVPYRHQVGGHTTLWRFSKRAVCKQLNNRENEFYEQIEKNHRDLLPFLPRYIGVLNVTFSKQPRRKSIAKKDAPSLSDLKNAQQAEQDSTEANGSAIQEITTPNKIENVPQPDSQPRLISQSMQAASESIPTVTFLDNQHILPRSLLQPAVKAAQLLDRGRSSSVSLPASHYLMDDSVTSRKLARPSLEERHANSWGTTMVNKKLRHEVFSDAFLKQPINVQRHKKAHQRPIPRKTLNRLLRPSSSDLAVSRPDDGLEHLSQSDPSLQMLPRIHQKTQSDLGLSAASSETCVEDTNDVTGTSAPEPDILTEAMIPQRKKRRHSGSALRTRPKDVSESRGNLRYWEEPDEAGYKGDQEDVNEAATTVDVPTSPPAQGFNGAPEPKNVEQLIPVSSYASTVTSVATSPASEFKRIPRPVNPKEAQVQRDSRVSYFLLLEDLTAGMKKPCIMDLKMGTRQYGVDATAKKQKSQQRKCAQTTSRELGVRVCGLQVWDVKLEEYVFRDKYYGRSLKAGSEFQEALTRFLFDGKDRSSILRHIPTVLQKLSKLEVIASRLRGYRFYAASLLVTYDGDQSNQDGYDTAIDDSTTDFATDTEDANHVRKRKNKREIDFKIADFANSLTPQDIAKDKSCPPQHPDGPDRGFLKGLRSLRRYFIKIQQDTRAELGLSAAQRNPDYDLHLDVSDTELVSE
ncbi:hypothetical protein BD289DRAFT_360938 [Coniella lustricola]|uniref:Kinase n=1 Tax=Coniella lustricola TaxID=2025994 RepID=A0A2T3AJ49_9PEZI|nr:hypothetical protein BD289DRAFT_360938 [Coniella lustricola]